DYRALALEARWADGRLEIPRLGLAALEGTLAGSGRADWNAARGPAFEARLEVEGMRVEGLLALASPDAAKRLKGRLVTHLAVSGAGSSWHAISAALAGGGDLDVSDGVIAGLNPAGEAMKALSGLPVLSASKLGRVAAAHPQVFESPDCAFEKLAAQLGLGGGAVSTRDVRLLAREWHVGGAGRYGFDGLVESKGVLAFSPELSAALVDAERRL